MSRDKRLMSAYVCDICQETLQRDLYSSCVAVCCSVLQCVAVCCSVLQYVKRPYKETCSCISENLDS